MWQLQLLLFIAIVAVIGSLFRIRTLEGFENAVGIDPTASRDQNGLFNGFISVKELRNNSIGNSQLTDKQGNVVLQPDGVGNVQLKGDADVSGKLSSKDVTATGIVKGAQLCAGTTCVDNAKLANMMTARGGRYALADQPLLIRANGDGNHVLQYDRSIDGPRLDGFGGGRLGTTNGNVESLKWDGNGVTVTKRLCVEDQCMTKEDLQKIKTPTKFVLADQPLIIRADGDRNHVLQYDGSIDGPRLDGFAGGRLGTTNGKGEALKWDGSGVTVMKQLCVEDQCMTKDDVRKFKTPAAVAAAAPTTSIANDGTFEFGAGTQGKEVNAGKIRYGGWDSKALNIVGAGKPGEHRVVRVWDALQLNEAIFRQDDDWVRITGDRNNKNAYNKGLAAKDLWARDSIVVGQAQIGPDACIMNTAGGSKLCMQSDGNLVVYNKSGRPTWASNTRN